MQFLNNFTYWNKLNAKTQRTNQFEINFRTANCKIRKSRLFRYFFSLIDY